MTTTHETHSPDLTTPLADNERSMLSVTEVEAWRDHQRNVLAQYRTTADANVDYVAEFEHNVEADLDTYLQSHGLTQTDANYDEIRLLYLSASINRIDDEQWYTSAQSRGEHASDIASGRDEYSALVAERLGRDGSTDDPEADEAAETDDDAERLRSTLDAAREQWSTISAKRQGRVTSLGIKDRKKAESDYHKASNAYIAHELASLLADPNETDDFKNVAVIQHLFTEQELLREQTKEKLKGTTVNKIVEFMNRGNLPTRIAKGVGVGVVAGFLGTVLAGATGAGLAAGGVIAASRFAKGYAVHSKDKIGTKSFEDVADAERLQEWVDENSEHSHLDAASDYFNESFEEDTKKEQGKRRAAFAVGAGSVAAGAALGYALHGAAEWRFDKDLQIIDGPNWNWPSIDGLETGDVDLPNVDPDAPDVNVPDADLPDLDNDGILDVDDHDRDGDGIRNGHDLIPNDVDAPDLDRDGDGVRNWLDVDPDNADITDELPTTPEISEEARFIVPNEGGFHTLSELNIPEHHWEEVWADAGEKLHAEGKTYMMDDGRWGWSRDMRLSDADIDLLLRAAERNSA